jgi:gas vesicle protein
MRQPLLHKLDQLSTDRWARRGVRMLLRAAWLSVCIWCMALGGHMLWGWPLRTNLVGALALALIGGAVALLLRPKLAPRAAASRLDQRFHLDEQLATAVEVAATNPPPGSIAARLLMESSHTAELLHRRIARRQRPPWQDLLTLLALGLIAIGLWVISGVSFPNLAGSPLALPPLASAEDPAQQLPQEPQAPGQPGQAAPGDTGQPGQSDAEAQPGAAGDPGTIQALADALRDQGATRPAAEAIDRGDLAGAAQELRELADQAGQLSQAARDEMASSLEQAADQIAGSDPQLADQLEQSADGLREGGQPAAEALDDLARAIEQMQQAPADPAGQNGQPAPGEQTGQDGQAGEAGEQGQGQAQGGEQEQSQGQGDGQGNGTGAGSGSGGEQRQAEQNSRLGVEGQPVPLESAGEGEVPAQSSGDEPLDPVGQGGSGGFTQGGASSDERVQVGADPLRVPIDERDVVQGYFQPQN